MVDFRKQKLAEKDKKKVTRFPNSPTPKQIWKNEGQAKETRAKGHSEGQGFVQGRSIGGDVAKIEKNYPHTQTARRGLSSFGQHLR